MVWCQFSVLGPRSRRVETERTLTLNNNGLMPDAVMEWDFMTILKTYFTAPGRWLKSRLEGKPRKFTHCINVPGHDYNWEYPEVRGQIKEFLNTCFKVESEIEVNVS